MTLTTNRGPNALSVIHIKGCWSTIRLKTGPFQHLQDASQHLNFKMDLIVQYNVDNEHTFVVVSAYLKPFSEDL